MKTYLRMLRYLRPYWQLILLNGLCVVTYAVLSGVSVLSVSPFVRILFQDVDPPGVAAVAPSDGAAEDADQQLTMVPQEIRGWAEGVRRQVEGYLILEDRTRALARFCGLLLLLFLFKNIAQYGQTYLTSRLEQSGLRDIRSHLFRRIADLQLGVFIRERTGSFISRLTNDVTLMRTALVGNPTSILRNGLMILFAVVILLIASWKLALVATLILPPNAFLISQIGKRLKKRSTRAQANMGDMANVVQETAAGARVVKGFGMQDFERQRFETHSLAYYVNYLRAARLRAFAKPISEMLAVGAITAILWFGGRFVLEGQLPVDRLFLFLTAMIWLSEPVKALIGVNNSMQEGLAAADRVFALMELPCEPDRSRGRVAAFRDEIHVEHVGFRYDTGRDVLSDIDVRVRPGQVVALVGPSGAGKSTFVDLLARYYEVSQGRILLDGVDVRDLSIDSLRSLLGIVTQEVILFHDTVRANIAYGRPDVPQESIEQAARSANAHEFIQRLPRGYDTVIGERGVMLSGGERQRVSIARAILRNPQILILDEATSALDSQSEQLIQDAVDRLMHGRTAFVVAHRLSTIQRADLILVFEDGRIIERGTHEELLATGGAYAHLHGLQFR
jgi:subfamily B ATP-binding cassette protein MsbA